MASSSLINDAKLPTITIQPDWNEVARLPDAEAWITAKYYQQMGEHEKIKTSKNSDDGKIKIDVPDNYQYISYSTFMLVLKHVPSGLKVAFVAPTTAYKVHTKGIVSVSAAESTCYAVSACDENQLIVWDNRTGEKIKQLQGHIGTIYKCRFFPSGKVVLSAGADMICRIWDAEPKAGQDVATAAATLTGHRMTINDVSIVDRGKNIITTSSDGTVKLWDVGKSKCLANIMEDVGVVNCCVLAESEETVPVDTEGEVGTGNKLLVAGTDSGLVVCSRVGTRRELARRQLAAGCNACVVLNGTAILGCEDGKIIQLKLPDLSVVTEWHESASRVCCIAKLTDDVFVCGRRDGTCTAQSVRPAAVRVQLTGADADPVRDLAFNGKWIYAGCRDAYIRKYDYNQIGLHFKTRGPFTARGAIKYIVQVPRTRYTREIVFYFQDLVVSFGGAAGLFLGASFISFVEILYFVLEKLLRMFGHPDCPDTANRPRPVKIKPTSMSYEKRRILELTNMLEGRMRFEDKSIKVVP